MKFLRIIGIIWAWGLSMVFFATWLQAALNPTHQIIIHVNYFNELWWEMILIPAAVLLVTCVLFYLLLRESNIIKGQRSGRTSRFNTDQPEAHEEGAA